MERRQLEFYIYKILNFKASKTETRRSRGRVFRNMSSLVQLCLISQVQCGDGSGNTALAASYN